VSGTNKRPSYGFLAPGIFALMTLLPNEEEFMKIAGAVFTAFLICVVGSVIG
jgi:hypothetical protein